MKTLLKIENLKKSFGSTEILKGINLDINEGEIISVLGPSGSGKSTLLRIISGILPLDEGVISIKDNIVSSKKVDVPTEKRDINMVFQDFALWPHMKVRDNIVFGLKIKKLSEKEIIIRLQELVSLLKLDGLIDRYPSELSGGQQQRVAIARALITKPTIVLLDEPLCNLDIQLRVEMRTEMAYLFRKLGTTVFHVTHDPSEAFAMADRIIIMNNGQIDQIDTPHNCYNEPKTTTVAGLLGAGNSIKKVQIIKVLDEYAQVKIGSHEIMCKSLLSNESSKIDIRFRPEDCIFHLQETENSIKIKIILSTFEGSCYRIKASTEEDESFSFLHNAAISEGSIGYISVKQTVIYAYN